MYPRYSFVRKMVYFLTSLMHCRYVSIVWPDVPYFSVYKVSDWSIVHSGTGRMFAWDTCHDRYALLESTVVPRIPLVPKAGSSRKAKEAAAIAAQAAAAAANAASAATVQVRILLDDGTSNVLTRSIDGRSEPVRMLSKCYSFLPCIFLIFIF